MLDNVVLTTPAIQQARERLRDILFRDETGLVLLDSQLEGRPLREWFDVVEVVATVSRPSLPSAHIAEVRQPGYAVRGNDSQTVLNPAKVVVTE